MFNKKKNFTKREKIIKVNDKRMIIEYTEVRSKCKQTILALIHIAKNYLHFILYMP